MGLAEWFSTFCGRLTVNNAGDISTRYRRITRRLNLGFRGLDSEEYYSRYVGSYGRGTAIRGFSDLDMLYELPGELYSRYNAYAGNGQSALLQAVRNTIRGTYPSSDIGGDGQVVVVSFSDGMKFEVVPAFRKTDGSFTYPDSNGGGRWRITNPVPEIEAVRRRDAEANRNLIQLCRMIRVWKNVWNVPMGGLLIDTLAYRFLGKWAHRDKSFLYYDWMSRDFFDALASERTDRTHWQALGSGQDIYKKGDFQHKARRCYNIACDAIVAETNGYDWSAKQKWREIYGTGFPD